MIGVGDGNYNFTYTFTYIAIFLSMLHSMITGSAGPTVGVSLQEGDDMEAMVGYLEAGRLPDGSLLLQVGIGLG
jgi:hypothetical protein